MSETTAKPFVITRSFNAPRELVFQCWTRPEHLAQWWGPTGMELAIASHELRPGGAFHFSMTSPDGFQMWAKFVYYEITPPEKLVYTNAFSDADANTVRAPFSPVFPLEVMNTVTFEEQDGKTVITVHGAPVNPTEEEAAFFASMELSMQQGFGGTFSQLDEYLTKLA
ncbi:SRPBCC domain-containing protein [Paenibacillus sp. GCM10023248]|uniref:SRPBCC family protein n=1 Tax=unclassified Paenibacillus TaxID=185978 RepID=UPI0023798436|nr:SRPBCC domain-containing protein [Paenibacillus sp. MAHUQ-63]MDD9267005.1 SRPBCC domain-containing protein [Paenibacillus sp. MAHUQ-63]